MPRDHHIEYNVMNLDLILQWIKETPSLLNRTNVIAERAPFEHTNDFPVADYNSNPRLGFLYQYLCAQLFKHSNGYELCAEEIQLIHENKTIGAIDFISHNLKTDQIEHWEVAIKFYLLWHGHWYGPNANDQLDKKLAHMLNHQLAMSNTDVFLRNYPQWQGAKPNLLIQGRLYINPFMPEPIPQACLGLALNPTQINGYWCYQSQMHQIKTPLFPLHRHQWMVGITRFPSGNLHQPLEPTHYQAADHRFWFIVPDHWPQIK